MCWCLFDFISYFHFLSFQQWLHDKKIYEMSNKCLCYITDLLISLLHVSFSWMSWEDVRMKKQKNKRVAFSVETAEVKTHHNPIMPHERFISPDCFFWRAVREPAQVCVNCNITIKLSITGQQSSLTSDWPACSAQGEAGSCLPSLVLSC